MDKQIHAYFSGRVQGVGFRFTVEDIAQEYGVFGWVKNLADGRVEVVAEAKEEALDKFMEKIKDYFSGYIKNSDIRQHPASGEYRGFEVIF